MGYLTDSKRYTIISHLSRILSYVSYILAFVLLIVKFLKYVPFIYENASSFDRLADIFFGTNLLADILVPFFASSAMGLVLAFLANYLKKLSESKLNEFENLLIGYIRSHGRISIDELAVKVDEDIKTVEESIAQITQRRQIKVKVSGREVILVEEAEKPVAPIPLPEAPASAKAEETPISGPAGETTVINRVEGEIPTPSSEEPKPAKTSPIEGSPVARAAAGSSTTATGVVDKEAIIKYIERGDIASLENLVIEGKLDAVTYDKIKAVYDAYQNNLISKESLIAAVESLLEEARKSGE